MPHLKSPKNQNRRATLGRPAIKITEGGGHLDDSHFLYDLQHGFHEKRSCETQLTMLIEDLHKVGKMVGNTHISQDSGNTGIYRELLVIPGNYWEIGFSPIYIIMNVHVFI